jgi:hypothetical protein
MKRILFFAVMAALTSCLEPNANIVYSGERWDIVRLNDSTFIAVPGLSGSSKMAPVVIETNQTDKYKRE